MKLDDLLALLDHGKPKNGEFMARCPGHNDGKDKDRWSLSVSQKDDKILLKCFAGCETRDVVKALGLKMSDLFLEKPDKTPRPAKGQRVRSRVEKVYPYYDATGKTLLYEVVREIPKNFKQRRPDGKGGYIWNLEGITPVIYRLPQILTAVSQGKTIHYPEGEKDVDNLVLKGFEATTSPMGANSWKPAYATPLHGAALAVVWVDKDLSGRNVARQKAIDLIQTAHTVKLIEPPGDKVKDISDWIEAGATAEMIQKLVNDAPFFEAPRDELSGFNIDLANRDLRDLSDGSYSIMNFAFYRHYSIKGEEKDQKLDNWVARIIEDITKDSGVDQERELRIRGLMENGLPLKMVTIKESSFNAMSWVREHWGIKCRIAASQSVNEHLRSCIEMISSKAKERIVYTHTGWREINGKMCYLSSNGAIGDPNAECELEGRLQQYALPVPAGDPTAPVRTSLEFLGLAKLEVTLPLWVAMYLAPLIPFEDTNFTLWYLGPSGSLKSTLEALALCHFGTFNHKTLPSGWSGTANEIERLMSITKDTVFVVDDWAPAADRGLQKEMESKSERILRAQANRQGRVRMRPDLGSQLTFDPRCLLITSGEQLPHGQSRNARILTVPIERTDFNMELLTKAQKQGEQYALAMSHYILWIQENWQTVKTQVRETYDEARQQASTDNKHLRLVDIVASMYTGLKVALSFAREKKAINETDVKRIMEAGWKIFNHLAILQDSEVNAQSPGQRFLEAIRTNLNSGKAILRDLSENVEIKPGQVAIGWFSPEGKVIYLNPGEAYQLSQEFYHRSGEDFTAYKAQTWQDLKRLNCIEGSTPTGVIWINGRSVRILPILRRFIFPEKQE